MIVRLTLLAACILLLPSGALADCKGVVKVTDISYDGTSISLAIRVYANRKNAARSVHYNIFLRYRGRLASGAYSSIVPGSAMVTGSTLVESDEDYADDEVETFVTIPVVDNPKVNGIIVTGCYEQ